MRLLAEGNIMQVPKQWIYINIQFGRYHAKCYSPLSTPLLTQPCFSNNPSSKQTCITLKDNNQNTMAGIHTDIALPATHIK